MQTIKYFLYSLTISLPFCAYTVSELTTTPANHVLFLMHTGNTTQALQAYNNFRIEAGSHDFELIEQIGLILLDQGFRTNDPETQLLTVFGAGISTNEKSLYILEDALESNQPELELIALNFLSGYHNDRADQALHRAMKSNGLLVRLEAAHKLASKKDPKIVGQIESLMAKVPQQIWPIFPQLFALSGTPEAKKILRKMLTSPDEQMRVASINSLAEFGHDDFLPHIQRLSSHQEVIQQEACAAAFGTLHDENSAQRLVLMSKNPNTQVRLAALHSLYQLGREDARIEVEKNARALDLFAITLLGSMPGSEETLAELIKSDNLQVRANAALALLELRDPRCLIPLCPIIIKNTCDLAILRANTQGKSLHAWRIVPSARQNFLNDPVSSEMSLHIRENIIAKAVELPESAFLNLAHTIFESQENDLVPLLIEVLETHPTPSVINLLKKHQQNLGAPLIRNYCNLALYRLKESGPYSDNLREWVTQQRNIDLIRFRPLVPLEMRDKTHTSFELTPQETSRLLVDAFEAFVSAQDDKGVDMLISVIQSGNTKNKYALIGLLMRAIQ